MMTLQLFFLGNGRVQRPTGEAVSLRSRSQLALLAYVALEQRQAHSREALQSLLWPEAAPATASNNLRVTLSRLRQLAADGDAATAPVQADRQTVRLVVDNGCWCDVVEFERVLKSTQQHEHTARAQCAACCAVLTQALDLYQGEFLAGFYLDGAPAFEEWCALQRERLHLLALSALADLAAFHEEQGELALALATTQRQLHLDPLNEAAYRQQMQILAKQGQRSAALAVFEQCRALLAAELQVEPTSATRTLYERLRSGDLAWLTASTPAAPAPSPSPAAPAPPAVNLPVQLTSFIGRQQELADLTRLLRGIDQAPAARLVTLIGIGGAGKTRLAIEAAARLGSHFAHGVCFVNLTQVLVADDLAAAVATALGVEKDTGSDLTARVCGLLRDQQRLLVLDNCEQIIAACAELAERLLLSAPGLHLLATSREALQVPGEVVYRVPALGVPSPALSHELPGVELLRYDAIRLFVERARAANPRFALSDQNGPIIAELCQQLDGIPLALELAAARSNGMTVEKIVARLGNALQLLTGGGRTVTPRHKTLRATIDWSFELLTPAEQQLLVRLAIFHGSCELEAIESVVAYPPLPTTAVLELLLALVQKSLVEMQELNGEPRFRLLETVRQYGLEKLADELPVLAERHCLFYHNLAQTAAAGMDGAEQGAWLVRLQWAHANWRAAWRWALQQQRTELALQMACNLHEFWERSGFFEEGLHTLREALAQASTVPTTLRAAALRNYGRLHVCTGDFVHARAPLDEALQLMRQLGDDAGTAATLSQLVGVTANQGLADEAHAYASECLAIYRRLNAPLRIATAVSHVGHIALLNRGEPQAALLCYQEALQLYRTHEDTKGVAWSLNNLGAAAEALGDYPAATRYHQEALELAETIGEKRVILLARHGLGTVALAQGRTARARGYFAANLTLAQEIKDRHCIIKTLAAMSSVLQQEGALLAAAQLSQAAAEFLRQAQFVLYHGDQMRFAQTVQLLSATLPPADYKRATLLGQTMALAEAVRLATG